MLENFAALSRNADASGSRIFILKKKYFLIFASMLVQTAHMNGLSREDYDALLAAGWFRGTGLVYKSEIVCMDEEYYSVQNIRYNIHHLLPGKQHRRMIRRNKQLFSYTVGEPVLDERREEIYASNARKFKAFVHRNLEEILLGRACDAGFTTRELAIYHGEKLIAFSYIDIGHTSLASILCVYDPEYARYSPGIFAMYLEIEYALRNEMTYYYPGYVLDKPTSFDYKLKLGETEWLAPDGKWYQRHALPEYTTPAEEIRRKMQELNAKLHEMGIRAQFKVYPYFTIGQVNWERIKFVRVPCYYTFQYGPHTLAASWDPVMGEFVLFDLRPTDAFETAYSLELSSDYLMGLNYELQVMRSSFIYPWKDFSALENFPKLNLQNAGLV